MATISVIVPVYKVEKYIHRCVDSILAQTFTDFELILVDDGSPDNCGRICDEYALKDNRIHVIHKDNGGLSDARNAGLDWVFEHSNSIWLTFIDSDDWISEEYLYCLYNLLLSEKADISCCNLQKVLDEKIVNNLHDFIVTSDSTEKVWLELLNGESYACGKLFPKSFFELYRFPKGRIYEDVSIIHIILFQAKRIVYTSQNLYYYYFNPNSISGELWNPKKLDALWAHEQQLKYFKNTAYKRSYNHVLSLYIACIAQSLQYLAKYKEFRYFSIKYRLKLRYYLIFKRKSVDYKKYKKNYYYKSAYPLSYRTIKRINKKISNAKELLSRKCVRKNDTIHQNSIKDNR